MNQHRSQSCKLVSCDNPRYRFDVEFVSRFANDIILVSMPETFYARQYIRSGKAFQLRIQLDNVIHVLSTEVVRVCESPYICLRASSEKFTTINRMETRRNLSQKLWYIPYSPFAS